MGGGAFFIIQQSFLLLKVFFCVLTVLKEKKKHMNVSYSFPGGKGGGGQPELGHQKNRENILFKIRKSYLTHKIYICCTGLPLVTNVYIM